MIEVIDTYPKFRELVGRRGDPLDAWVDYLSEYPELLDVLKLISGSSFTCLLAGAVSKSLELIKVMDQIHDALVGKVRSVESKLLSNLGIDLDTYLVIYVGFGLGAVLPTKYLSKYAVLFDLLGAAEADLKGDVIEEALAHGLCHLIHSSLMGIDPLEYNRFREDPLFLIYSEGFATKCECLVLNKKPTTLPLRISEQYDIMKFVSSSLSKDSLLDAFSFSKEEGIRNHGYTLALKLIEVLESRLGNLLDIGKLGVSDVKELIGKIFDEQISKLD